MKKSWKVFILTILLLLTILIALIIISSWKVNNYQDISNDTSINISSDKIILYYGEACPHCHELIKFIKENNYEDVFNITYKEVYYNETNKNELMSVAKKCNLNTNSIGVPFVYYKGKCYIGVPDIEAIFTRGRS